MEIPSKFFLGGIEWTVIYKDNLFESQGRCDPVSATILLERNSNKQVLHQCFVHELVHCLFYQAGVVEHDEVQVDKLSYTLHQYLEQQK
jgi:hypothetical protein|tara:strand:+ start:735 stop:1001 length:267 start_codon:yes stop_codon:yes gene_type:complete